MPPLNSPLKFYHPSDRIDCGSDTFLKLDVVDVSSVLSLTAEAHSPSGILIQWQKLFSFRGIFPRNAIGIFTFTPVAKI